MLNLQDPNALSTLITVEGEEWGRQQEARRNSPYGFYAHLEAFQSKVQYLAENPGTSANDFRLSDFGEVAGIYGAGGYSRYAIAPDGEILLLGWSVDGLRERRERAIAAGITISGACDTSGSPE